jgi:hypothetical protein
MQLWGQLESMVEDWRNANYAVDEFGLIGEVLRFQKDEDGNLLYLRDAQFRALETYWYLRLVLGTPRFLALYEVAFPKRSERYRALGIQAGAEALDYDSDAEYLADLAKEKDYSALAESLSLDYPSYIMALTMGAGKTVLSGTIIATEFAMSLEYPDEKFMKNALVFAPGKTILESLKQIAAMPFDKILPPRLYRQFMANLKLVYAQDNGKDIQVDRGGFYNLVVTNTEKIILRRPTKKKFQSQFDFEKSLEHWQWAKNQRLETIASLPGLGIFSDEAHHTYGNKIGDDIKRVRETINHLHEATNVIAVVNTTGTPYSGRQTLQDVVFWYGLNQGIEDNILKSLHRSILAYSFSDQPPEEIFSQVLTDFFSKYKDTKLPGGQAAKIAFYFKTQEHLDESRSLIEKTLTSLGESPAQILMNTQSSSAQEVAEFKRLNNANSSKRIILLVGKGTEGWDCPSLFATALIRELTSSNNFILQAATRCLRQTPGNNQPATIYIESHNQRILNDELHKTFGTDLANLNNTEVKYESREAIFTKTSYPRLAITKTTRRVVKANHAKDPEITLKKPTDKVVPAIYQSIFSPVTEQTGLMLSQTGEETRLTVTSDSYDLFAAAHELAANYHLKTLPLLQTLEKLYPSREVPRAHFMQLHEQVESQTAHYEEEEQRITQALALIKFVDDLGNVFGKTEDGAWCHTIRYRADKANLITDKSEFSNRNKRNLGFHYTPYNFDSAPEKEFMREMLERLQTNHQEVEDIYFTGALSDTRQTDLHFQYLHPDGTWRNYFPDFVITKTNGSFLIVEVKAENKQNEPEVLAKEKAVQRLENIPENKFHYHILYTDTPIPQPQISEVTEKLS